MIQRSFFRQLKRHAALLLCLLVVAATVAFIFHNSLETPEESSQTSSGVVEVIKPPLDPHERIPLDVFTAAVRKAAHFIEFFILGAALLGVVRCLVRRAAPLMTHPPVGAALLFALLVAVIDEWIQLFTARGSSVSDVLLDFCGAVTGFLLAAVGSFLVQRLLRKRRDQRAARTKE